MLHPLVTEICSRQNKKWQNWQLSKKITQCIFTVMVLSEEAVKRNLPDCEATTEVITPRCPDNFAHSCCHLH